jgi:hypothetical protein
MFSETGFVPVNPSCCTTNHDFVGIVVKSKVQVDLNDEDKNRRKTFHTAVLKAAKSIKDFNAETITSLFSFFICGCQHPERKTICLYIFLISER